MEIEHNGVPFLEYRAGSPWVEALNPASDGEFVLSSAYFRSASHNRIYSLDPYKILDLLGDMGGLLDIVLVVGVILTVSFVKQAFLSSLLHAAYQVQSYTENNSEYYQS